MRRLLAGGLIVSVAACSPGGPADAESGAASPSPSISVDPVVAVPVPEAGDCQGLADSLSLREQTGQLFMLAVSTSGLDAATRRGFEEQGVGSALLLGQSTAGAQAISAVTADLAELEPAGLPILVAADQEGGTVQRLKGPGFSDIPTAVEQSALGAEELRAAAQLWGDELLAAGVHYNLAPVADVVPADKQASNAPIGALQRNYGNDAAAVSAGVVAFTSGMADAGVLTSLKHFPGLGEVLVNTDFGVAVDDDITVDDEYLEPFRAGIEAGADSVMISSAIFSQIDPDQEGVFSEAIVTDLLRGQLGFDGVAISDDLGAAAAVGDVPTEERASRFFAAGGDLLINADPALMADMLAATLAWAEEDPANAARVAESAARVLTLKQSAGLLSCASGG